MIERPRLGAALVALLWLLACAPPAPSRTAGPSSPATGAGASGTSGSAASAGPAPRESPGPGRAGGPGPVPRTDPALVYDGAHDTLLLFGGRDADGRLLTDTWTGDGAAWHRHPGSPGPAGATRGSMAFDGATGRVLLFAGAGTWSWDGERWARLLPAHEPPRAGPLAYNPSLGVVVMVAGGSGPTWGWNGADWYPIPEGGAPPMAVQGIAYDVRGARLLAVGDGTWAFIGLRWSRLGDLPGELPAPGSAVTSSSILNAPVAYSGGRLWAWDGRDWKPRDAEPRPPVTAGATLADDEKHGRLVLVGGTAGAGGPAGTWAWTPGGGWSPVG